MTGCRNRRYEILMQLVIDRPTCRDYSKDWPRRLPANADGKRQRKQDRGAERHACDPIRKNKIGDRRHTDETQEAENTHTRQRKKSPREVSLRGKEKEQESESTKRSQVVIRDSRERGEGAREDDDGSD